MIRNKKNTAGASLIELLIIVGVVVGIIGIMILFINPSRQLAEQNNIKRHLALNNIANAISLYSDAHGGDLPPGITLSMQNIKTGGADICNVLTPQYISGLPVDPLVDGEKRITDCKIYDTGYQIAKNTDGRIMLQAPNAQLGEMIFLVR